MCHCIFFLKAFFPLSPLALFKKSIFGQQYLGGKTNKKILRQNKGQQKQLAYQMCFCFFKVFCIGTSFAQCISMISNNNNIFKYDCEFNHKKNIYSANKIHSFPKLSRYLYFLRHKSTQQIFLIFKQGIFMKMQVNLYGFFIVYLVKTLLIKFLHSSYFK